MLASNSSTLEGLKRDKVNKFQVTSAYCLLVFSAMMFVFINNFSENSHSKQATLVVFCYQSVSKHTHDSKLQRLKPNNVYCIILLYWYLHVYQTVKSRKDSHIYSVCRLIYVT